MSTDSAKNPDRISIKGWSLAAVLFTIAALGYWARPTHLLADQAEPVNFEQLIPKQFGHWQLDESQGIIMPSPDVQAAVNAIYSQTVTRAYVNANGDRIMLSVAYGRNQSDAIQVHKPEGCYAGQGFGVSPVVLDKLNVGGRTVPVRRVVATRMNRVEPVSYWVLIGDTVSAKSWQEKLVQLHYGLQRKIPDGLLVRVSSIQRDQDAAFHAQDQFIADLVQSIPQSYRPRVVGTRSQL